MEERVFPNVFDRAIAECMIEHESNESNPW